MDVIVYDNGGRDMARYTVVIDDNVIKMSEKPLHPKGINQYIGNLTELNLNTVGKKITYMDIPEEVRAAIRLKTDLLEAKHESKKD